MKSKQSPLDENDIYSLSHVLSYCKTVHNINLLARMAWCIHVVSMVTHNSWCKAHLLLICVLLMLKHEIEEWRHCGERTRMLPSSLLMWKSTQSARLYSCLDASISHRNLTLLMYGYGDWHMSFSFRITTSKVLQFLHLTKLNYQNYHSCLLQTPTQLCHRRTKWPNI